jgi:glucose-1-phosphate thymidylyltransferase
MNPKPESELMGVILAAGKGTRMRPFSEDYPKPILPIAGRPLLHYQVDAMRELGIRDIVVVIGHLGYKVVRALGDGSELGVRLRYVEQEHTLGIAHAVSRLEPFVDRPFFLFLGDIFFDTENLGSMVDMFHGEETDAVLAVKREPDMQAIKRNFVVHLGPDGVIRRVIEKPRHPRTDLKGCGLYLFDVSFFDAVRRTPRTAMRDEYEITDAIQTYIDDGFQVRAADVIREDLNISFPEDLLVVNLHYLRRRGLERWIGNHVELAEGTIVENSVIMDGVKVEYPIAIRDSLIFPNRTISRRTSLERKILLDGREVDCAHVLDLE